MAIPSEDLRYRILIVEDNEDDAELELLTLLGSGLRFDHRIVADRDSYTLALDTFEPDLVLTDYHFPAFTGEDVIRILGAVRPRVPVIVVTGTLGDERAATLIRVGATDYILKDRLERLPDAARRALTVAEERRRREAAELEASAHQARLAHLFRRSLDGILVLGARGEIVDANPAAAQALGFEQTDLIGNRWSELIADEGEIASLVAPEGEDARVRERFVATRRDGQRINLDVALAVDHEADGSVFGYVIFRDITADIVAEGALRHERELQAVLRGIAHGALAQNEARIDFATPVDLVRRFLDWDVAHLYELDTREGTLVATSAWADDGNSGYEAFVNDTTSRTFLPGEGLVGHAFSTADVVHVENLAECTEYLRLEVACAAGFRSGVAVPVMAEGRPAAVMELYSRVSRPDDEATTDSLRLVGHELGRLFERRWFDERMRQRQRELERLIENAPDIIMRTGRGRRVQLVNSRIEILGLSVTDVLGRTLDEAAAQVGLDPSVVEQFDLLTDTVWGRGEPGAMEWSFSAGDTRHHFLTSVAPEIEDGEIISALSITRDITTLKEAQESLQRSEEQLQHAQRLESIGRLAGGVAHDFNNILTAVNGYLYMAKDLVAPESRVGRYIASIRETAERASRLTQQLLLFSRRAPTEKQSIEVNDVVGDILKMLSRLIGENVELATSLTADSTTVAGDRGKIEQVVMNLVVNARDAMPDGGRIDIETARETGELPGRDGGESALVDVVRLTVRDTGIGMEAATKERVFEPFFTTKGRERGTGLGLPVVYGVVQEHGGRIDVDSTVGEGSAFHILLPSAATPATDPKIEEAEELRTPTLVGHVLLVEDDEAISQVMGMALANTGLRVSSAASLAGAEATVREGPVPDLIVSDVALPDGSGTELPERLAVGVPFIFVSGYLEDRTDLDRVRAGGYRFLQKPYDIRVLVDMIAQTLNGETQ